MDDNTLRFTLIVGIDSLRTRRGQVIDKRYRPNPGVGRLEERGWAQLLVPLPALPQRFDGLGGLSHLPPEDQWEYVRLSRLYQHLYDDHPFRSSRRAAGEVLYWSATPFPRILGFVVARTSADPLIGQAEMVAFRQYRRSGYRVLQPSQCGVEVPSFFLPPFLQAALCSYWAYGEDLAEHMPGYYYVAQHLFDWIGFSFSSEDVAQLKLMLLWERV